MEGNRDFGARLLRLLEAHENTCPVMLSSSVQATLAGRYAGSVYGQSKAAGEGLFFEHAQRTGANVLIYRFPNLYGKWCRPNYNSVVATFCDAIANDREYHIDNPNIDLELLYIDDLVTALLDALLGKIYRCHYDGAKCIEDAQGPFCYAPGGAAYHPR